MRRVLEVLVSVGFLVYTGVYVFVYLFRAFRLAEPSSDAVVYVWHGDPMIRAVLVAVLFAIGLLLLMFVVVVPIMAFFFEGDRVYAGSGDDTGAIKI